MFLDIIRFAKHSFPVSVLDDTAVSNFHSEEWSKNGVLISTFSPELVSYFSKPKFIALIGLYLAGQYILWYPLQACLESEDTFENNATCCRHFIAMTIAPEPDDPSLPVMREAFKAIYNDTVTNGWLIMDHWASC